MLNMGNSCLPICCHLSYLRTLRQSGQPGGWLAIHKFLARRSWTAEEQYHQRSCQNYNGLTVRSNFAWSRSRGTGDTTQSYLSIFVGRNLLQQQPDGMGERRSHFTVQRGPFHPLRRHSFKRLWLCRQRSERHRN